MIATLLQIESCGQRFGPESPFSAADLARHLADAAEPGEVVAKIVREAHGHRLHTGSESPRRAFLVSRILHSLGTALACRSEISSLRIGIAFPTLLASLSPGERHWLDLLDSGLESELSAGTWAERLHAAAFRELRTRIVSAVEVAVRPRNALRSDEIAWGRASPHRSGRRMDRYPALCPGMRRAGAQCGGRTQ